MRYDREYSTIKDIPRNIEKDISNKKIAGVCAGIAKHFALPRFGIRIAAIVAFFALPVVTIVAYIVATLLLPNSRH